MRSFTETANCLDNLETKGYCTCHTCTQKRMNVFQLTYHTGACKLSLCFPTDWLHHFLCNHCMNSNEIWQEARTQHPLQILLGFDLDNLSTNMASIASCQYEDTAEWVRITTLNMLKCIKVKLYIILLNMCLNNLWNSAATWKYIDIFLYLSYCLFRGANEISILGQWRAQHYFGCIVWGLCQHATEAWMEVAWLSLQ